MSNADLTMGVHKCLSRTMCSLVMAIYPEAERLDHVVVSSASKLLRSFETVFYSNCTILQFAPTVHKYFILVRFVLFWLDLLLFGSSYTSGCCNDPRRHYTVVLICIYLIISNTEHFHMYFLVI